MPLPPIKLDDMPVDTNIFALMIGENGAGKSSAIASMVNEDDPRPICILDIDKRAKGIKGSPWVKTDKVVIQNFVGNDILLELEGLFTEWETKKGPKFPYQLVALDGFTGLSMLMIDNSFDLTAKMTKGDVSSRGAQGHPKIGSVNLPGLDEFGYEQAGFKNVMTFLKYGLKCNVICTAHWTPKWKKDKDTNQTIEDGKRVHLRPAIVPNVMMWFDEVWYFEKSTATKPVVGKGAVKYEKHIVEFRNELARTTMAQLPSSIDITEKPFYPLLKEAMAKQKPLVVEGGK